MLSAIAVDKAKRKFGGLIWEKHTNKKGPSVSREAGMPPRPKGSQDEKNRRLQIYSVLDHDEPSQLDGEEDMDMYNLEDASKKISKSFLMDDNDTPRLIPKCEIDMVYGYQGMPLVTQAEAKDFNDVYAINWDEWVDKVKDCIQEVVAQTDSAINELDYEHRTTMDEHLLDMQKEVVIKKLGLDTTQTLETRVAELLKPALSRLKDKERELAYERERVKQRDDDFTDMRTRYLKELSILKVDNMHHPPCLFCKKYDDGESGGESAAASAMIENLKSQHKEEKEEMVAHHMKELDKWSDRVKVLMGTNRENNEKWQVKYDMLLGEKEELSKQLAIHIQEAEDAANAMRIEHQSAIGELEDKIDNLEHTIKKQKSENRQHEQRLEQLEQKHKIAIAEVSNEYEEKLRTQWNQHKAEKETLELERMHLINENRMQKELFERKEAELIRNQEKEVESLKKQIKDLKAEIQSLKKQLREKDDEIKESVRDLQEIVEKNATLQSKMQEMEEQAARAAEDREREAAEGNDAAAAEKAALVSGLEKQLEEKDNEIRQLRRDLRTKDNMLNSALEKVNEKVQHAKNVNAEMVKMKSMATIEPTSPTTSEPPQELPESPSSPKSSNGQGAKGLLRSSLLAMQHQNEENRLNLSILTEKDDNNKLRMIIEDYRMQLFDWKNKSVELAQVINDLLDEKNEADIASSFQQANFGPSPVEGAVPQTVGAFASNPAPGMAQLAPFLIKDLSVFDRLAIRAKIIKEKKKQGRQTLLEKQDTSQFAMSSDDANGIGPDEKPALKMKMQILPPLSEQSGSPTEDGGHIDKENFSYSQDMFTPSHEAPGALTRSLDSVPATSLVRPLSAPAVRRYGVTSYEKATMGPAPFTPTFIRTHSGEVSPALRDQFSNVALPNPKSIAKNRKLQRPPQVAGKYIPPGPPMEFVPIQVTNPLTRKSTR